MRSEGGVFRFVATETWGLRSNACSASDDWPVLASDDKPMLPFVVSLALGLRRYTVLTHCITI